MKHDFFGLSTSKASYRAKGVLAIAAAALFTGTSAKAQVIDTFDTTLSTAYIKTTILDNDTTRNVTFATNNGILQSTATATTQAEQSLLLRSDFTLAVGQTLRADLASVLTSSQDFSIAVGTAAALTGVTAGAIGDTRASSGGYVQVGLRFQNNTAQYVSGGYNTTAPLTTMQAALPTLTGVYITRTSATTFSVGYNSSNGPDTQITSYTLTNSTVGNAVGFYSDMRAAGTIGNFDNLRITTTVPEPSTWVLTSAFGGLVILRLSRRTRHACQG